MEKEDIEKNLEELPYLASQALNSWRKATRDREVLEAVKFLAFKQDGISSGGPNSDDIVKMKYRATPEWKAACDAEADCESAFYLLNERHLSNKKSASVRSAY